MSDKKRRDITLGEMQDECFRRSNEEKTCNGCDYSFVCPVALGTEMCPNLWNLTDPPRFTEAQMALLNGLWEIGTRKLTTYNVFDNAYYIIDKEDHSIGTILISVFGKAESPLDLAELLGKDGAE